MASTKACTNCGAENDLLLTNCLFCKSSLPQVDINSISNEDLILNAGEWVGKARQYDHIIYKNDKNANLWTGKGIHEIHIYNSEIVGNAEKYLSLIQVRSISNLNLLPLHDRLRKQLDENKTIAIKSDPKSRNMKFLKYYMLGVAIFFIIMILIASFS